MKKYMLRGVGVGLSAAWVLSVAGCSGGSNFNASPTPSPTPSASPSPAPVVSPGRLAASVTDSAGNALLTFSEASRSLAISTTRFSATYAATVGGTPSVQFAVESGENLGQLVPIVAGQIFVFGEIGDEVPGVATLTLTGSVAGIFGTWEARSGRIVVVSIEDARVRYRLEDVVLTPRGSDDSGPEVRLEGTGEILR